MRAIHVVRPHRQLEAVQSVRNAHHPGPVRPDAPGVLVDLLHGKLAVVRRCAQAVDVPLVLADEIAPRRPDREAHIERVRTPRFDLQVHLHATGFGLLDSEGVRVHGDAQCITGRGDARSAPCPERRGRVGDTASTRLSPRCSCRGGRRPSPCRGGRKEASGRASGRR